MEPDAVQFMALRHLQMRLMCGLFGTNKGPLSLLSQELELIRCVYYPYAMTPADGVGNFKTGDRGTAALQRIVGGCKEFLQRS